MMLKNFEKIFRNLGFTYVPILRSAPKHQGAKTPPTSSFFLCPKKTAGILPLILFLLK